jgi:hypothetical protein
MLARGVEKTRDQDHTADQREQAVTPRQRVSLALDSFVFRFCGRVSFLHYGKFSSY